MKFFVAATICRYRATAHALQQKCHVSSISAAAAGLTDVLCHDTPRAGQGFGGKSDWFPRHSLKKPIFAIAQINFCAAQ
jgi:hypothetical protein